MLFIIIQKAFGRYYNAPKTSIMSFMRQTLTTMLEKTIKKLGGSRLLLDGLPGRGLLEIGRAHV